MHNRREMIVLYVSIYGPRLHIKHLICIDKTIRTADFPKTMDNLDIVLTFSLSLMCHYNIQNVCILMPGLQALWVLNIMIM